MSLFSCLFFRFFFFKQKTAYEMRISDWSSDVCSSDLGRGLTRPQHPSHFTEKSKPAACLIDCRHHVDSVRPRHHTVETGGGNHAQTRVHDLFMMRRAITAISCELLCYTHQPTRLPVADHDHSRPLQGPRRKPCILFELPLRCCPPAPRWP